MAITDGARATTDGAGRDGGHGALDGARESLGRVAGALTSSERNVADGERILSALGGAALLGMALRRRDAGGLLAGALGAALLHRGATGHCHVYGALGMNTAEQPLVQQHGPSAVLDAQKAVKVEQGITIDVPRSEMFRYWRDRGNLARTVSQLDEAEIINEVPEGLIGWRSTRGARTPNAGSVHLEDAPDGRGTRVRVVIEYVPRGGKVGLARTRLRHGEPEQALREDLERLKVALESRAWRPELSTG